MSELDFSNDWEIGGPIVEREGISLEYDDGRGEWLATWISWISPDNFRVLEEYGPTPLVAAYRVYKVSRQATESDDERQIEGVTHN